MNKKYLPYDLSLELKKLKFREETSAYYFTWDDERLLRFAQDIGDEVDWNEPPLDGSEIDYVSAPLFQEVFRWFREKHNMYPILETTRYIDKPFKWINFICNVDGYYDEEYRNYDTYEEAEIACLKRLIEIVKNK